MKKIEINRIMIPTDFSETADLALEHACFMAQLFRADLHLVHVMTSFTYSSPIPEMFIDNTLVKELQDKIQDTLDAKAEEIRKKYSVNVTTTLTIGAVVSALVEIIKDNNIDIVVLGSHGASGIKELLIGSNAYRLVIASPVPVLTIQSHAKKLGFTKFFLPIDSSPFTREKIGPAVSLAEKYGAEIFLYGCLTEEHRNEYNQMKLRIEQSEEFIKKHGIPVKSMIEPVENLARATYTKAKEMGADLIVIMTDQEPSNDLFIGPYTQQIVHRSKIPVLTIPTYAYKEWIENPNTQVTSLF